MEEHIDGEIYCTTEILIGLLYCQGSRIATEWVMSVGEVVAGIIARASPAEATSDKRDQP
jgi:hypothetical protein